MMNTKQTGNQKETRLDQFPKPFRSDNSSAKRTWQLVLGILLSGLGLVVVVRGVDWQTLGRVLKGVHMGWFLLAVAAQLVCLWVGALRWRWIFWPHPHPPVAHLFGVMGVAQLTNLALPGKLGFPLRAVIVGGKGGQERMPETVPMVITTLIVEKILEGITLLVIAIFFFLWSPPGLTTDFQAWTGTAAGAGVVLLVVLVILMWLAGAKRLREDFLERLEKRLPSFLVKLVRSMLMGLDGLRAGESLGWMWGLALLYWILVTLVNLLVVRSVDPGIPWEASLLLLLVLQIGVRIPSAPGNLGVFDYLGVLSLAAFDVEKSVALGITLLLHLVYFLPPAMVGVGYLLWTGTGLSQINRLVRGTDRHS